MSPCEVKGYVSDKQQVKRILAVRPWRLVFGVWFGVWGEQDPYGEAMAFGLLGLGFGIWGLGMWGEQDPYSERPMRYRPRLAS